MADLNGKIVLITGAKGGLGTAVTNAFLAAGASVIGVSRSIKPGDFPHPNFSALPASVSTAAGAANIAADVVARLGRIDVLAHLVGGFAGGQSIADMDEAALELMLDVNLRAAFHMLRAVLPPMRVQKSGRILVVASRQAVEPSPMLGAYNISKAAVLSLVKTAALENKDANISVNAVLPGGMDTPSNQGANLVRTAQVAALLVHLAGDDAADISGAAIPIYGSQL